MKKILSIDIGTKTGWALCGVSADVCSGVWDLSTSRFSGGGMKFVKFRSCLEALIKDAGGVDLVVFEAVRRHLGVDAAHAYGGFLAVLTAYCEEQKIPYQGVGVQAIKKHATGKGNANKQQMIDAAREKWGEAFDSTDEVDALWLLHMTMKGKL